MTKKCLMSAIELRALKFDKLVNKSIALYVLALSRPYLSIVNGAVTWPFSDNHFYLTEIGSLFMTSQGQPGQGKTVES